ncbi:MULTISPECIES: sugar phosphate isomerase/epimerase [unclassified Sinorhizobium]|uniref:sugar phosphate isomerase/epimerase family protein n=1 Tax=unclassified Sinorhizobium TaxID=2613772 RepID=UPI0024C27A7A|nr:MULTISPECIES: sugar phosphate isomerase/epimerase [unclassified Sinorhizobium]MDK1376508.1 sugar phosphate isomerase/epimerase [Sinorhizobium sp. 6-70]MDK1482106.1 sugar phosphate isomerase/epimerase [Sinorhizobium sp. 6-117]
MNAQHDLRNLSVANLTAGRVDPVEFIVSAAEAGFGAVGLLLMSATPARLEHELVGSPEAMRAVKSALADHPIRVFDIEAFILSPATDFERMRRAMEAGAELGATYLSSIGTEFAGNSKFLEPSERIDLFARLCDEAANFGLRVGVEFMLYRDILTWKDALDLIQAADRPNASLIVDFLHLHRAGGTAAEIATVPAHRIAYAQLCDASSTAPDLGGLAIEARRNRLRLGEGAIDLKGLIGALPEGTQLVIETPIAEDAHMPLGQRLAATASATTRFFNEI